MASTDNIVERRKHKRFKIRDGAFAAVKDIYIVGPLQDISRGGLAFRYVDKGKKIHGLSKVDIFFFGRGFYLREVPSETVSDFSLDKKDPCSSIIMKRCGMKFKELTKKQTSHLEEFIQKYADRRSDKDRRQLKISQYDGPERRSGIERRKSLL
jgi:hypothetical protein